MKEKKRYTVRYVKNQTPVITAISNYSDLNDLLQGDAKKSIVEVKIGDRMPLTLHDLIADHNTKIKDK